MALKHISWSRVMLHLLFWVMIVTWYAWGFGLDEDPKKAFTNALSFLPGHMLMVYVLLYFLIPKFLLQNKIWHFLFGFGVLVGICAIYARLSSAFTHYCYATSGVFYVGWQECIALRSYRRDRCVN